MRLPILSTFVLLAIAAVSFMTGCETVDRMHYDYESEPIRIKEPNFVRPPVTEEVVVSEPVATAPLM